MPRRCSSRKTQCLGYCGEFAQGDLRRICVRALGGTTSEPFVLGDRKRIASKVIDDRGKELMRVVDVK